MFEQCTARAPPVLHYCQPFPRVVGVPAAVAHSSSTRFRELARARQPSCVGDARSLVCGRAQCTEKMVHGRLCTQSDGQDLQAAGEHCVGWSGGVACKSDSSTRRGLSKSLSEAENSPPESCKSLASDSAVCTVHTSDSRQGLVSRRASRHASGSITDHCASAA